MAFKTAAEMFGDGGGFGPAVPYDTSNPPGTSSGNRGIQFGEQLTAAIANRTHYALALNDEDLNTRLVDFETDGLDAAYDLGTAGPAGGGRVITKDAGAVKTSSAHSAITGDTTSDPSHFQADSLADTAGSSIGYDFRGKRSAANGQTGNDPTAGYLDRRVFAKGSGNTVVTHAAAATVNPGGAAPATIRLGAGTFHSSSVSDLIQEYDLIEVSGTAAHDGIYLITGLGAADTDVTVELLDGLTPSFVADEGCTISVYRLRFGSFGSHTSRGQLTGVVLAGMSGAPTVLDLVPGRNRSTVTDSGAANALRVLIRNAAGAVSEATSVDYLGRTLHSLRRSAILETKDQNIWGGDYISLKDYLDPGMGHVIAAGIDEVTASEFYAGFLSLREIDATAPGVTPGATLMTFTGASPSQGEVLFNAALTSEPDFVALVSPLGTYVEITGSAGGGAYDGLYLIDTVTENGNGGFFVKNIDGTTTSHFPTSGTFTIGRIFAGSVLGHNRNMTMAAGGILKTGGGSPIIAENVLGGSGLAESTALALTNGSLNSAYLLRCFVPDAAVSQNRVELVYIDNAGNIKVRNSLIGGHGAEDVPGFLVGSTHANAGYWYETARDIVYWIPAEVAQLIYEGTFGSSGNEQFFQFEDSGSFPFSYSLRSRVDFANAALPLSTILPEGAELTRYGAVVKPGSARTGGNRIALRGYKYQKTDITDTSAPIAQSGGILSAAIEDDGTTNWQSVEASPTAGTLFNTKLVSSSDQANALILKLVCGNDAGTNLDALLGFFVGIKFVGPSSSY